MEIEESFKKHEDEIEMQKKLYLDKVKKGSLPSFSLIQDHAKKLLQI